eukprot:scaffold4346_cov52-Attheya_sp.AAC.6
MPCHAMPCHAMPCHAMPCHAMPCHAMPCHAIPYHTMPYHASPLKDSRHKELRGMMCNVPHQYLGCSCMHYMVLHEKDHGFIWNQIINKLAGDDEQTITNTLNNH